MLGKLPGTHDDWLVCMISSQTRHYIPQFDEIVNEDNPDFAASGLKVSSVIRVGRLAVVKADILLGTIGDIAPERLQRIKACLSQWLLDSPDGMGTESNG